MLAENDNNTEATKAKKRTKVNKITTRGFRRETTTGKTHRNGEEARHSV
jgi:hypothetical protein